MELIATIGLIALPAILLLAYALHAGDSKPAPPAETIKYTQAGYKSTRTGYHSGREVQANLYQDKG